MIRKVLLSTVLAVTAGSALAADLPARVAPAPYIPAPIFTWTGFYVGLNAGAGFNNNGNGFNHFGYPGNVLPVLGTNGAIYGLDNNNNNGAFTGGGQIGYNWQFGSFVAGGEADINYIDRGNGHTGILPTTVAVGNYYTVDRGDSSNYFGTVRARLGYAFDRALIYVTGGLAYGGNGGNGTVFANVVTVNPLIGGPNIVTRTALIGTGGNSSSIGWTLGGGLEYAFSNAWSVKAEYLHVDIGSHSRTFVTSPVGAPLTSVTLRNENKFDVVRVGLNYRF